MPGDVVCRVDGTTTRKNSTEMEKGMGELIVLGILIGIGAWLYKAGKRIGSRKGFNVGRWRGRRR